VNHAFSHPLSALGAGAVIAVLLAGCTGSDGEPTSSTTSGSGGQGTTVTTTSGSTSTSSGTGGAPVAESSGPVVTQGISGGGVGKSASYKMVFAVGQPAMRGKAASASYQIQSASGTSGSGKQ
jgi:hypothetical protein